MSNETRLVVIIDSNSVLHRAYHALPRLTTKKGELVNAIYGFLLVFFKTIKEFQPDFIVATFDYPAPTFRHRKYKEYKATRPKIPDELSQQIPKLKEILEAFNIPILEKEGFEADDLIATVSKLAIRKQVFPKIKIIILSGDLDTLQLVDSHTRVFILRRGVKETILYDREKVQQKYQGLTPNQLPDFKALKGDPSDNIPGLPGIGEKTAIELIKEFQNLEKLYQNLEQKTPQAKKIKPKLKQSLVQFKDQAFFSRELAKVNPNVPIDFKFKKWGKYSQKKIVQLFKRLEFYSLIKRLSELEKQLKPSQRELKLW